MGYRPLPLVAVLVNLSRRAEPTGGPRPHQDREVVEVVQLDTHATQLRNLPPVASSNVHDANETIPQGAPAAPRSSLRWPHPDLFLRRGVHVLRWSRVVFIVWSRAFKLTAALL